MNKKTELDCSIGSVKLEIDSKDAAVHVANSILIWTIKRFLNKI